MKLTILLIFLFTILFGCRQSNQKEVHITSKSKKATITHLKLEQAIKNKTKYLNLSKVAKNIEYLPLKNFIKLGSIKTIGNKKVTKDGITQCSKHDALVSYIRKIEFNETFLFISSVEHIWLFDKQTGEYIRQIGKIGRGPGEYRHILDFNVDFVNNLVHVHGEKKIYTFNFEGKFIKSIRLPRIKFSGLNYSIALEKSDEFAISIENDYGNSINRLAIIDQHGTVKDTFPNHSFFPFSKHTFIEYGKADFRFYKYNNYLFFKEQHSDTIFNLNLNKNNDWEITPRYVLGLNSFLVPPEKRIQALKDHKKIEEIKNSFISVKLFFSDSLIFIPYESYVRQGNNILIGLCLHDVKKNETWNVLPYNALKHPGLNNDIDGGPIFYPKSISNNNKVLAEWFDAYQFKSAVLNDKKFNFRESKTDNRQAYESLRNMAEKIHDNDNPVIMFVNLK